MELRTGSYFVLVLRDDSKITFKIYEEILFTGKAQK